MAMRCRYSRRLYILKSQYHNPDYIDDSDLVFLENLITFHIDYVNNCTKSVTIESSLLPEKYRSLFNTICSNYSLIDDSSIKTELYKKFDLEYKGEERHARNIREQIINYLQQKKGNIFTNRRVEFFLKIAMTTKHDELKKLCKEMLFSIKSPRRTSLGKRNKDFNCKRSTLSTTDDQPEPKIIPIEEMETLLFPYLPMIHPHSYFDYNKVSHMINEYFPTKTTNVTETNVIDTKKAVTHIDNHPSTKLVTINQIKELKSMSSENDNNKKWSWRSKKNTPESVEVHDTITKSVSPNEIDQSHNINQRLRFRHSAPIKDLNNTDIMNIKKSVETPSFNPSKNQTQVSKVLKQSNVNRKISSEYKKLRQSNEQLQDKASLVETSRQLPGKKDQKHSNSEADRTLRYNRRNNSPPALTDRLGQSTKDLKKSMYFQSENISSGKGEVIEISDDEDDGLKPVVVPDVQDVDKMIDFLIHRCTIKPHLHPTLLKDHQMRIELNGFLLLVNLAIRMSLKANLDIGDKKLFDCIFIGSVIVGLNCTVLMDSAGITIDRLSPEDFNIAVSRLASVQVPVKEAVDHSDGEHHSIRISPDIGRLVHLTMYYVHSYHSTGKLVAAAEVGGGQAAR